MTPELYHILLKNVILFSRPKSLGHLHLANLFLRGYETMYMNELFADKLVDGAKLLCSIFCYQDDCIVFNDFGLFRNLLTVAYPVKMVLKGTNVSVSKCNYLDINVKFLQSGIFTYKPCDKRQDYNCEVIHYVDLTGNVPTNQPYVSTRPLGGLEPTTFGR